MDGGRYGGADGSDATPVHRDAAEAPAATPAYRLGPVRASGSIPSGRIADAAPAGAPILRHVHGAGLSDVVVVVTRHFGGTELGVGGLVGHGATVGWFATALAEATAGRVTAIPAEG